MAFKHQTASTSGTNHLNGIAPNRSTKRSAIETLCWCHCPGCWGLCTSIVCLFEICGRRDGFSPKPSYPPTEQKSPPILTHSVHRRDALMLRQGTPAEEERWLGGFRNHYLAESQVIWTIIESVWWRNIWTCTGCGGGGAWSDVSREPPKKRQEKKRKKI